MGQDRDWAEALQGGRVRRHVRTNLPRVGVILRDGLHTCFWEVRREGHTSRCSKAQNQGERAGLGWMPSWIDSVCEAEKTITPRFFSKAEQFIFVQWTLLLSQEDPPVSWKAHLTESDMK